VEGRFSDGILRALEQLTLTLEKRSRRARRDPECFERRVTGPVVSRKVRALRGKKKSATNKPSGKEATT
jgi:hypothetical protein